MTRSPETDALPEPPSQGQLPLTELAAFIRQSSAKFATPPVLTMRTVLAVCNLGDLEHYASVLRVGQGNLSAARPEEVVNHAVSYVRLLEHVCSTERIEDEEDLLNLLTFWLRQYPDAFFGGFSGPGYTQWYPSGNDWGEPPCFSTYVTRHYKAGSGPPQFLKGPVFHEGLKFFGTTLESAAAHWLGPGFPNGSNNYWIVIPDLRARFSAIELDGTEVRVGVESRLPAARLVCVAYARTYDGHEIDQTATVSDSIARIDLGRAPRQLELFLYNSEASREPLLLDRFSEDERGSTWGRSVLFPTKLGGPAALSLEQARESGEGEQIEFKPLLLGGKGNTREDAKVNEVIETVVAFANGSGGTIYLGVDKYGNLQGTLSHVLSQSGSEAGGRPEKARDLFAARLRNFIAEGVSPSIRVSMDWIMVAEHLVLRVIVPRGPDRGYHTVDENRFFIRRGATNRPMNREELKGVFLRRQLPG
jgi:hypothetical protein